MQDADLILDARTASPALVASTLDRYGVVVLRQALSLDTLDEISEAVRAKPELRIHPASESRGVHAGMEYGDKSIQTNCVAYEPEQHDYKALWCVYKSAAFEALRAYLKSDRLSFLLAGSYLRTVIPTSAANAIPFHQDGFGFPDDRDFKEVTCWFLLWPDRMGDDVPTMEMVATDMKAILPLIPAPDNPHIPVLIEPSALARAIDAGHLFRPKLQRGDCILFHGWHIHRGFIEPGMTSPRHSLELRFLSHNADMEWYYRQMPHIPPVELHPSFFFAPKNYSATDGSFSSYRYFYRSSAWRGGFALSHRASRLTDWLLMLPVRIWRLFNPSSAVRSAVHGAIKNAAPLTYDRLRRFIDA